MTCNNKHCQSTTVTSVNQAGLCHKCEYLHKNSGYFPNAVQYITTCNGCGDPIPSDNAFCWHCEHEQEECWCH